MRIVTCPNAASLQFFLENAQLSVVCPGWFESSFPEHLREVGGGLAQAVEFAVASPEILRDLAGPVELNDALVFVGPRFFAKEAVGPISVAEAVAAIIVALGADARNFEYLAEQRREQAGAVRRRLIAAIESSDAPAKTARADESPYDVLKVATTATDEEVEAAFRARIKEYHPDYVERAGEELRKLAEERTKQINMAREEIRRARR